MLHHATSYQQPRRQTHTHIHMSQTKSICARAAWRMSGLRTYICIHASSLFHTSNDRCVQKICRLIYWWFYENICFEYNYYTVVYKMHQASYHSHTQHCSMLFYSYTNHLLRSINITLYTTISMCIHVHTLCNYIELRIQQSMQGCSQLELMMQHRSLLLYYNFIHDEAIFWRRFHFHRLQYVEVMKFLVKQISQNNS